MKKLATLRAPESSRILQRTAPKRRATRRARGGGGNMAAYSEVASEARACALYGHRTAALTARVIVLILALLLALVLTSQSRAADGDDAADEPMVPFTIGGGLTVAALGGLVLLWRRVQDGRAHKRYLEERIE